MSAAASLSAAVASSAAPRRVRRRNHQTAPVVATAPAAATTCASPSCRPPKPIVPETTARSTERKSGFHRYWARPRSRIMRPKVVNICDSMGASVMRRITSRYTTTPIAKSARAVKGRVKRGSSLQNAKPQKLAYIPSIRNSPWAKFTMSITPKMSVRPVATSA